MKKQHRGTIAVFMSCEDRAKLDEIQRIESKRTGYRITLKAVLSKIIQSAK